MASHGLYFFYWYLLAAIVISAQYLILKEDAVEK
jgi:hypothetical protein